MNINRARPTGVKTENLDLWLSGVINDAIRDAREAGLSSEVIAQLMLSYTRRECREANVEFK